MISTNETGKLILICQLDHWWMHIPCMWWIHLINPHLPAVVISCIIVLFLISWEDARWFTGYCNIVGIGFMLPAMHKLTISLPEVTRSSWIFRYSELAMMGEPHWTTGLRKVIVHFWSIIYIIFPLNYWSWNYHCLRLASPALWALDRPRFKNASRCVTAGEPGRDLRGMICWKSKCNQSWR